MAPTDPHAGKLFTVCHIPKRGPQKGVKGAPRLDLAPMNHAAACNFMDACRTD